jgi:NAD(P)-dependent dehydrogenase (short-subunit alcohol dehydrogenase family)
MTMLLKDKTAIVYGAGGRVGGAVATAFAREGARVFLAGRRPAGLEEVAAAIADAGGRAEVAVVDALDRDQVDRHVAAVVSAAGAVDVSLNAVSIRGDLQGSRLVEMALDDFLTPIRTAAAATFLTATAAARHMVERGSGAILTLSTSGARLSGRDQGFHATGGFGVACGAVETLTRNLAGEVGPHGVRVVCLRPDALPETWPDQGEGEGAPFKAYMSAGTVLRRLPRLAEVADTAAFLASDRAGAITGTVVNVSCGSVVD